MDGLIITAGRRLRRAAAALLAILCVFGATGAPASPPDAESGDVVVAQAQPLTHILRAYGQIEPIALVQVRTADPGTLEGLRVVPGDTVVAGETLARLSGPRMQALLIARVQLLRSARAREGTASRTLNILRHQLAAQLATRQAVDSAQSDLVAAQAAVQTAAAQLREARTLQAVRAPASGTVMAVHAANGEQARVGETILTLQPAGKLWIHAAFYGGDAALLRVGMTGRFQPSVGGDAIPVKVAAIASNLEPDGGRSVGLLPLSPVASTSWVNGQWGALVLQGPSQVMVVVPTTALILDRGTWWVLIHTAQGNKPQKVVPGPTRGWETSIVSGLTPGQQVVVQDAFLKYHRGIAQSYQPPD